MSETVTITLPASRAVQAHIEHLQATLTKRNAQIDRLTAQLVEAESGEPNQSAIDRAYKRGWQAAATAIMEVTDTAAQSLGKLRSEAWKAYLAAERSTFTPPTEGEAK